jgi:hypothetical protein
MRKRTVRKHYALVNPIEYAIEGAATTQDTDLNKLRMIELQALQAFRAGKAGLREWHEINSMMNLAETMAKGGIGVEVESICMQAQDHLIDSAKRYERIGRMGATGPALQCWQDLYEYHDLQRQSVARSVYEEMIRKTTERVRNKAPGVIEL